MEKMRALVSVTDKRDLVNLKPLADTGWWDFVSTGGTAKDLEHLGIRTIPIEQVTGFPEMMDGRRKTIDPKIAGGILLVVVNLYDFDGDPSIERIDIGGPTLLRAAAKNWESVTVVVDPSDYDLVVGEFQANGDTSKETKWMLACKVFEATGRYDTAIAKWFKTWKNWPE